MPPMFAASFPSPSLPDRRSRALKTHGRRVLLAILIALAILAGATPQQFSASWAFVLEPMPGGQTRLMERFRVWYGESGFGAHVVMPVVGFGVFVMLQKQMVGIKARAERSARERAGTVATTFPVATATKGEPMAPVKNGRDKHAEEPELVAPTVG